MINWINNRLDTWARNRFLANTNETEMESLWIAFAKRPIVREVKVVTVKKGKAKYNLIVVQTPDGNIRINVGRV